MDRLCDSWELRRYTKRQAYRRASDKNILLHTFGVVRMVYDRERAEWKPRFNGYNPLAWLLLAFVVLFLGVWEVGVRQVWEELWDSGGFFFDLYSRQEDGSPRYLPMQRAFSDMREHPHNSPNSA
jgi:hypothetical protein